MFQASHDKSIDGPLDETTVDVSPAGETELIELAPVEDREAFTRLFQRYNEQICTYLGRFVGNADLGRDLAQETFLQAWKSLPTLHSDLSLKPWLYRVATNLARSHLRHEQLIRWFPWMEHNLRQHTRMISRPPSTLRSNHTLHRAQHAPPFTIYIVKSMRVYSHCRLLSRFLSILHSYRPGGQNTTIALQTTYRRIGDCHT